MVGRRENSLRLICITCLIGGVISLPVMGFGSNKPSPAWSDFSSPGSAYWPAQDASGTATQHYSDLNDGGVYSNYGPYNAAGYSGWVKNGGMDSGSHGYNPAAEFLTYTDKDMEKGAEMEEPVLSDVSGLDPLYHFNSRSRYQQGRKVFSLSRYMPGEVMDMDIPVSHGKGHPGHPMKAGY